MRSSERDPRPARRPFDARKFALICAVLSAFLVPALLQYYLKAFDGPRQFVSFAYGEPYQGANSYTIYLFGDPVLTRTPAGDSAREIEHLFWSLAPVTLTFSLAGFAGWFVASMLVRRVGGDSRTNAE